MFIYSLNQEGINGMDLWQYIAWEKMGEIRKIKKAIPDQWSWQKGVQEELGTARTNVMLLLYTSLYWVKEELWCTGGIRRCVDHSVTILTGLSCANMEDFPGSYSNMLLGSALYFLVSTFLSGGPHWFLGDKMDHNAKTKLVWPTDSKTNLDIYMTDRNML